MPKKVDHHERRVRIADALMRIAATQGLQAVSLRHVAAEAEVSTGMVQHYFRTKDEMMTFAIEVVADRVKARLADAPDADTASARARIRHFLVQLLPLDEPRHLEAQVALAFHAYAAVRPDIAREREAGTAVLRDALAEQIRASRTTAPPPCRAAPDPATAATALLALVEGLGIHILRRKYGPDEALATLDAQLDLVLPE